MFELQNSVFGHIKTKLEFKAKYTTRTTWSHISFLGYANQYKE